MSSESPRRSRAPWLLLPAFVLFLVGIEALQRLTSPEDAARTGPVEAGQAVPLVRPVVRSADAETLEVDFGVEQLAPLRLQRGGAEMEGLVACLQADIDREIQARRQDEHVDTVFRRMRRPPLPDRVRQLYRRCLHRPSAASN